MSIAALSNATLNSVALVSGSDNRGNLTWATPTTLNARVMVDQPTRAQVATLNVRLVDVTCVVYIPADIGLVIKQSQKIMLTVDGRAAQTLEVAHVIDGIRSNSDLSHFAAFLKEVR